MVAMALVGKGKHLIINCGQTGERAGQGWWLLHPWPCAQRGKGGPGRAAVASGTGLWDADPGRAGLHGPVLPHGTSLECKRRGLLHPGPWGTCSARLSLTPVSPGNEDLCSQVER